MDIVTLFQNTTKDAPTTASTHNSSSSSWRVFSVHEENMLRIAHIVWYTILVIISTLGNTIMVIIILKNRHMRTVTNKLILNMAISDLFFAATVLIPELYMLISNNPFRLEGLSGRVYCILGPFIRDCSITVSILSMIAVALERFFAVVFPLRAKPCWMKAKIIIPLTWLISVASFAVYFQFNKLQRLTCYQDKDFISSLSLFVVITFFIIPLSFLTITYTMIIWRLQHHNVPGNQSTEARIARRKRNKNATKLGIFIVVSFFISWCPYHLVSMIVLLYWKGELPLALRKSYITGHLLTAMVSYISIASNPIVCLVCSSKFRECFVRLFKVVNVVSTSNTDLVELRHRQNGMSTVW